MDLSKLGEEKKGLVEDVEEEVEVGCDIQDCDEDGYEVLCENEEFTELPDELADLRGKRFGTERALLDELDRRGFGDLHVVLWNEEPYMISPSKEHHTFTEYCVRNFLARCGKWGHCTATHNIYLVNDRSREPDISYWGYPRCNRDPETGELCLHSDVRIIPDVVVQFCWRNTFEYEAQAVNDMMTQGLEYEDGPLSTDLPRVGYLIMMKFSKRKRRKMASCQYVHDVAGMDIYRLPHGTTVDQARDPK